MPILRLTPAGKDYLWGGTRLRDEYDSLEELCAALDVSRSELEERLASIGYQYNEQTNQFI